MSGLFFLRPPSSLACSTLLILMSAMGFVLCFIGSLGGENASFKFLFFSFSALLNFLFFFFFFMHFTLSCLLRLVISPILSTYLTRLDSVNE